MSLFILEVLLLGLRLWGRGLVIGSEENELDERRGFRCGEEQRNWIFKWDFIVSASVNSRNEGRGEALKGGQE